MGQSHRRLCPAAYHLLFQGHPRRLNLAIVQDETVILSSSDENLPDSAVRRYVRSLYRRYFSKVTIKILCFGNLTQLSLLAIQSAASRLAGLRPHLKLRRTLSCFTTVSGCPGIFLASGDLRSECLFWVRIAPGQHFAPYKAIVYCMVLLLKDFSFHAGAHR